MRSRKDGAAEAMNDPATNRSFPWAEQWPEIGDPHVRAAFAAVPRHTFIETSLQRFADEDAPLPIGEGQTISQPFVVALMVQALDLHPGQRVLEIGTGSGYQTAILCELTASPGSASGSTVHSIERLPVLAKRAARTLATLGYHPHLRVGDGAVGWPEAAPFDAIIVSAAAPHLPRPLWEQLAPNGRLILPVGTQEWDQQLWLVRKLDGQLAIERLGNVRFVPMISPLFADPEAWVEV
jgi:protein-L-isoaspartate(D-aspartate) O-methyltransferase